MCKSCPYVRCHNYRGCFAIFNEKRLPTVSEAAGPGRGDTYLRGFRGKTEKACNKAALLASYNTKTRHRGRPCDAGRFCRGKAMAVSFGIIPLSRSTYVQSVGVCFPIVAATVPDGYQCAVTLFGGEDANCVVTGPTTTGANRSIHCSRSSPTVSNCHFLRNLSVGMERGPRRGLSRAGSQTRRRHQTHDRQLHLRRQF